MTIESLILKQNKSVARLNSMERILRDILGTIRAGKTSTPTTNKVTETGSKVGSSNKD